MLEIAATLFAVYILLAVAFPDRFIPFINERRKKKFGSTYWGHYEGTSDDDSANADKVEVDLPARKERVIAGSSMYAAGRGISFRR